LSREVRIDSGSFRDPSGYVFYYRGDVYRSVNAEVFHLIQSLQDSGVLRELASRRLIVETEVVAENSPLWAELRSNLDDASHFLRHEKIAFISYPYEWTYNMLVDAAQLQLDLQLELLKHGCSLKDASVFNVQFAGCQPIFIDVPSIEVPPRMDLWVAYGQFCRLFLFPLLLKKYANLSTKAYYLAHIDGMSVEEVYRCFGLQRALRPALLLDVFFQQLLQSKADSDQNLSKRLQPSDKKRNDNLPQVLNLRRLKKKLAKLAGARPTSGGWVDYYKSLPSYSREDEQAKIRFITRFLHRERPVSVLDLGCNTGQYSLLAAEAGATTVALDSDHDCVDSLYVRAKSAKLPVLPLWMDISNMSPALGFQNKERKSFLERADFDCVFALALLHHLLVNSRITLEGARDFLLGLTKRWLVIEFIDVDDPMFQKLLLLRENIYHHIKSGLFEKVFLRDFELVDREQVGNSGRTLYLLKRKTACSHQAD
jgi:SAM-dependent methyltransferase